MLVAVVVAVVVVVAFVVVVAVVAVVVVVAVVAVVAVVVVVAVVAVVAVVVSYRYIYTACQRSTYTASVIYKPPACRVRKRMPVLSIHRMQAGVRTRLQECIHSLPTEYTVRTPLP